MFLHPRGRSPFGPLQHWWQTQKAFSSTPIKEQQRHQQEREEARDSFGGRPPFPSTVFRIDPWQLPFVLFLFLSSRLSSTYSIGISAYTYVLYIEEGRYGLCFCKQPQRGHTYSVRGREKGCFLHSSSFSFSYKQNRRPASNISCMKPSSFCGGPQKEKELQERVFLQ